MGADASKPQHPALSRLLEARRNTSVRPRGLVNFGSTCYFNATITALFGSPLFRRQVLAANWPLHDELAQALYSLFHELAKRKNSAVSPRDAFNKLSKLRPNWTIHHQQDAHELLNFLLNHLDDCQQQQAKDKAAKLQPNGRYRRAAVSPLVESNHKRLVAPQWNGDIDEDMITSGSTDNVSGADSAPKLFEGTVAHVTRCLACDNTSTTAEKFYDLCVDMAPTLDTGLEKFCRKEYMKPTEKYFCEECQQHQNAVRYCRLKQVPQIAIFQLKRFRYDSRTGLLSKIRDVCTFPLTLKLPATAIHNSAVRNVADLPLQQVLFKMRQNLTVFRGTPPSDALEPQPIPDAWVANVTHQMRHAREHQPLSLCAVVCHIGGCLSAGHYVSIVRGSTPSGLSDYHNWWLVDDENVSSLTAEQMQRFCQGIPLAERRLAETVRTENAYLLFYESMNHSVTAK
eukprot:Gregarina_sp_Poly_1__6832@NODE_369_length_9158_cov_93_280497_g305_i0_p3_GENE_NODE_369_length_9158_cov_93_280497_g305_i0NODE_369_length_9158_cov_93_280497_g305_i0_p3_ORF_typecomplete_len456_score51_41UCH/PF00443_29/1_8e69UCH_1/PF13423_6/2_4e24_NODE_369_length_9158_cov_93_280497_g305_i059037270